jgi:hypothetical protein
MTKLHYERVPAKLSKTVVEYVADHGDSDEQCAKCDHYVNPTTCKIVAGRINPDGWCNRFSGREDDAYATGGGIAYQRPIYGGSLKGAYKIPHSAIKAMGNGDPESWACRCRWHVRTAQRPWSRRRSSRFGA